MWQAINLHADVTKTHLQRQMVEIVRQAWNCRHQKVVVVDSRVVWCSYLRRRRAISTIQTRWPYSAWSVQAWWWQIWAAARWLERWQLLSRTWSSCTTSLGVRLHHLRWTAGMQQDKTHQCLSIHSLLCSLIHSSIHSVVCSFFHSFIHCIFHSSTPRVRCVQPWEAPNMGSCLCVCL